MERVIFTCSFLFSPLKVTPVTSLAFFFPFVAAWGSVVQWYHRRNLLKIWDRDTRTKIPVLLPEDRAAEEGSMLQAALHPWASQMGLLLATPRHWVWMAPILKGMGTACGGFQHWNSSFLATTDWPKEPCHILGKLGDIIWEWAHGRRALGDQWAGSKGNKYPRSSHFLILVYILEDPWLLTSPSTHSSPDKGRYIQKGKNICGTGVI